MCGIAGIIDFENPSFTEAELIKLCAPLKHRGPDDAGFFLRGGVGLASRRLAVIDLSNEGHMPMSNEDKTLWLVFNGEIYNFQELREQLISKGYRFRSRTDTEVILHAYEEWGEACVSYFLGMFAFVIWDEPRKKIFAARDRLGVKPFFYFHEKGRFVFASEPHVLLDYVKPSAQNINRASLDYYLAFGYVPPDCGFVQGVKKLPPAHVLLLNRDCLLLRRYWDVSFRPSRIEPLKELQEMFDEKFHRAVKRRLVSDVPMGCFLSGGIDSGLVTAIAARESGSSIRTFSVGFSGTNPEDDERPLAKLVAQKYGTEHETLEVSPHTLSNLPKLLWHLGEPFADVSLLAFHQIAGAAKKHITVALTGDGGDESFGGYANVMAAYGAERFRRMPKILVKTMETLVGMCPQEIRERFFSWHSRWVLRSPSDQYDWNNHFDRHWRESLYKENTWDIFPAQTMIEKVQKMAGRLKDAEMHLFTDLHLRLPGDYLTKVDIASSAVSLEVRSPFLDHELVEFAASIPLNTKLLQGAQKGFLRDYARRYLPKTLLIQKKRGFAPSLNEWLRKEWAPKLREWVEVGKASGFLGLNRDMLRMMIQEHLSGKKGHAQRLWSLFCLEIWWALFVDRTLTPEDRL